MTARSYRLFPDLALDHRVALGGCGERSFGELRADVARVAERLPPAASADAPPREVLIACTDRYLFTVALLASWSRGHAAALPPSHRPKTLSELAASDSIAATLHDGEAEQGWNLSDLPRPARDAVLAALPEPSAGTQLVTLYTSGSSGVAQRQVKRAAQLLGEIEVLNACFGAELARMLCTVPARHIYGLLFGVLLPMRAGAAFIRDSPLHAGAILELARTHETDALCAVPAHLQAIASAAPGTLGPLRRVFCSGAELRAEAFAALHERLGLSVIEVFGSTETGGIGYRKAPGAPFQPFQDVRVVADDGDRLLLYSPRLAAGTPQPHACADRVSVLASGAFRHLGRADRIVKIGGTRVSLDELEQRARSLPGVRDVAVVARDVALARSSEILLAAVGEDWDAARMRSALSAWFEPVAMPRRYRFVSELPREPTGKLRKDAMLALFELPIATRAFERGGHERHGAHVRVTVRPPPELLYFRGHFEDWPVLPGVTQLGLLAVDEARSTWPDLGRLCGVRRLKFKRPVRPGEALDLELVRIDDARVDFSIHHAGEPCSSGSLMFGAKVTG